MRDMIGPMWRWWRRPRRPRRSTNGRANGHAVAPPSEPMTPHDRLGLLRSLHYPSVSLAQLFDETAQRFADVPAVVYVDVAWTYRQLAEQINRCAGGLARIGVRRGDRVLITLPNCPEFIVCFMAIQKLGAVVVNAGPLMGVDDLGKIVEMTHPRLIVGLDLQAPIFDHIGHREIHRLWVTLKDYQTVWLRVGYRLKLWTKRTESPDVEHERTMATMMEQAPARPPSVAPLPNDVALLQPTGGTTGTLKVAELTHANLIANAAQMSNWVRLRHGQERVLAVLPMFHVYGLSTCLTTALLCGGTMYPLTRFKVEEVLAAIANQRPTVLPLVPAIIEHMCDQLEAQPRPDIVKALENTIVISGAAPLLPATQQRFERLTGVHILQGYGLTEASPVTHVNPQGHEQLGAIGLTLADTRMRVVDPQDTARDVPPGEVGEMWISGPQVMRGYFNNPQETARVLSTDADGNRWLHTGDLVRIDDNGYTCVVDRAKEMIIRGGLKVYPGKVEQTLMRHPKVADAAVIGRDDPVHTQIVTAIIVPREVITDKDAFMHELRALCREHLAPYEVPSEIEIADALPRNALGKLQKFKLAEADRKEAV